MKNRPARTGRNPRTGAHVSVEKKSVPFFKTGKEMRERLNKDERRPRHSGARLREPGIRLHLDRRESFAGSGTSST